MTFHWRRPDATFRWQRRDGAWFLVPDCSWIPPDCISVQPLDGFWRIQVHDRPCQARYSSEQGAKLDAWQLAYSLRRAIFGAYRIRLAD
jgi:hypothetical protein